MHILDRTGSAWDVFRRRWRSCNNERCSRSHHSERAKSTRGGWRRLHVDHQRRLNPAAVFPSVSYTHLRRSAPRSSRTRKAMPGYVAFTARMASRTVSASTGTSPAPPTRVRNWLGSRTVTLMTRPPIGESAAPLRPLRATAQSSN